MSDRLEEASGMSSSQVQRLHIEFSFTISLIENPLVTHFAHVSVVGDQQKEGIRIN